MNFSRRTIYFVFGLPRLRCPQGLTCSSIKRIESGLWLRILYPQESKKKKRHDSVAACFPLDMFAKFVLVAKQLHAATLNCRRPMSYHSFNVSLVILLETEIHVALWTVVSSSLIVRRLDVILKVISYREMFSMIIVTGSIREKLTHTTW